MSGGFFNVTLPPKISHTFIGDRDRVPITPRTDQTAANRSSKAGLRQHPHAVGVVFLLY
jgi:hypothetical protein